MAVNKHGVFVSKLDRRASRRVFACVQGAKAGVGALLTLAYVFLVGRPDTAEAVALGGLCLPAVLALLAFSRLSLSLLESLSLALFAALIGYLAALTGGLVS